MSTEKKSSNQSPEARSGTGAGGSGSVSGSYSMTTSEFTVNNSYRIAYTARGTGAVTKIRACAHVRAYGLVGSGGVGVVFADDPCSTTKGKTNSFSRGRSYTAFAACTTMQYDARFSTPSGSFQIAN